MFISITLGLMPKPTLKSLRAPDGSWWFISPGFYAVSHGIQVKKVRRVSPGFQLPSIVHDPNNKYYKPLLGTFCTLCIVLQNIDSSSSMSLSTTKHKQSSSQSSIAILFYFTMRRQNVYSSSDPLVL